MADLDREPLGVMKTLPGLIVLVAGAVFARSLNPSEFNWDVAWLLYVAESVLDGAVLYTDIFEENPPLIVWFSMLPVELARVIGLPTIVVYNAIVGALSVASCALVLRLIRQSWPDWPPAVAMALVGLLLCLETIAPGIDYGQRENLLFIVFVPYLFSAAARLAGRPVPTRDAIIVGVFCAPGLALKPFFVAPWIAVEMAIFWTDRSRWRCPENAIIAGFIGLFYLWLLGFNPAYRAVLELIVQVAASYQGAGTEAIRMPAIYAAGAAVAAFVFFRPSVHNGEIRRVAMVAALGFLAVAVIQQADFSYRYFPAEASSYLVLGLVLLGLMSGSDRLRGVLRFSSEAIPALCMAFLLAWSGATLAFEARRVVAPGPADRTIVHVLSQLVRQHAQGKPIWVMSTSVNPAFPVVNLSGAKWASRYCCVSFIASVYTEQERRTRPFPYHDMSSLDPLEQRQYDEVIEDLRAAPPELIIVDGSANKQAIGTSEFRFIEYFRRDRRFAKLFLDYELMTIVGPYRIYKRKS